MTYVPVFVTIEEQADKEIIVGVGEALDADVAAGFDHLAMARTSDIDRAKSLLKLYQLFAEIPSRSRT